jgi:two-component system, chemotaxis family, sensor kinase CheA
MDELEIDRQALIETFLAEAADLLAQLEQGIVALESRPDDAELLRALFRIAHTLKGSAGLAGFGAVGDVAHALEELLEPLRGRRLAVDRRVVDLLLQATDALREAVGAGASASSDRAQALRELIAGVVASGTGAPAPSGGARAAAAPSAAGRTLRVAVRKLDQMLDLSGEIGIARGRLTDLLETRASATREELLAAHRDADRLYLQLQELVMKARMVPVGPVFHQHVRLVRDLAAAQGKQARLVMEGGEAEVDTAIVEAVRDPLTHMIRNAVDHGIELPEVRRARGKDACGRIVLRAVHDAGTIVIQVVDDGAGLPRARIAERAQALGLVRDAAKVTEEEAGRLVFEPGLSTSEAVTDVSGRGVGMDVVRRNVEALRGSVSLESREGAGTAVTIRLPLTLAIIEGLLVGVAGGTYILPLEAVVECAELGADARPGSGGTGVLQLRGKPLPYLRLRDLFGVVGPPPKRENVVVVQHGTTKAGVAVDVLHGESQTVIKPLGRVLQGIEGVSGSSVLGNGKVALILDVPGLMRETLRRSARASA